MLSRIRSAVSYRTKWAALGVFYLRQLRLTSVRVGGRRVAISLPPAEKANLEHELGRILFDDCYHLASVRGTVRTVLDIGANIGLFALAARHHFPRSDIHCYEPNPDLLPHLNRHSEAVGAHVHADAVGSADGMVSLKFSGSSLHTLAELDSTGDVPVVAFSSIVDQLDRVDLLKLDCEGAEWQIFHCEEAWRRVRTVVMEYHLWAKVGSTVGELVNILTDLGFSDIHVEPSAHGPWGFAWATRAV